MSKALGETLKSARTARRLDIKEVADHIGVSASAVSQWESGRTKPGLGNLLKTCEFLGIEGSSLLPLYERSASPSITVTAEARRSFQEYIARKDQIDSLAVNEVAQSPDAPLFASLQGLARDVPVRGIAVGGDDADFQMNGQENDFAIRPPALAGVKGLFALVVSNDSMYPAWRPNATFYINPTRAPQIGDDVVIEMLPDDSGEPGKAFLKRLKARTPTKFIVEQFNPPMDIEFDRNEVRLYRVVPWEEALGIS